MRPHRLQTVVDSIAMRQGFSLPVDVRYATVTAVGTGTATVTFAGSSNPVAVHYLSSYTPTVNDYVLLLRVESDLIILGKVA